MLSRNSPNMIRLVFCAILILPSQESKPDLAVVPVNLQRFRSIVNVKPKELRIVGKLTRMAEESVRNHAESLTKVPLTMNHLKE